MAGFQFVPRCNPPKLSHERLLELGLGPLPIDGALSQVTVLDLEKEAFRWQLLSTLAFRIFVPFELGVGTPCVVGIAASLEP